MRRQARGASARPQHHAGYWRQRDLSAAAFDADGFYKLGDALRFQDPDDPSEGLLFDGRIAEDFKLATGTWVNVGPLRARLLAELEPYARDVVIAGADCNEIGALIFPHLDACRRPSPTTTRPTSPPMPCDRGTARTAHGLCRRQHRQLEPRLPRHVA